jgi:DNA-binding transcriptional MerR regulator
VTALDGPPSGRDDGRVPPSPGLTISQLAASVGVTVRAIRHYHERGLLPEPARDVTGYRRYGTDDIRALASIKRLAEAGVPLAYIPRVRAAGAEQLKAVALDVDTLLASQIDTLNATRGRLAQLAETGPEAPVPIFLVEHLRRLTSLGLTERQVAIERDTWTLLGTLYPDNLPGWVERHGRVLEDPRAARLHVDLHNAREWSSTDPRLERLARRTVALGTQHRAVPVAASEMATDLPALTLVEHHARSTSPAWAHLDTLTQKLAPIREPARRDQPRGRLASAGPTPRTDQR